MTFLFWNLCRKPLESVVTALVSQHAVDVLLLAECEIPETRMLLALNSGPESEFFLSSTPEDCVAVYTRFPVTAVVAHDRQPRYTIWRLGFSGRQEILLAAAHLPSSLYWRDSSQYAECIEFAGAIREAERKAGHSRTLVVGDLNVNPFDDGVVAASGLNAVMTTGLATRRTRTVQSREYPVFYNPMWRFFGDRGAQPSGTYFYQRSEHVCYFWNIFDQVLVRPDLICAFSDPALRIVDSDGSTSLLNEAGYPDGDRFSDHLPITFALTS
ncbi:MAG: endonuclease/exonuclease/phosphatase family protein [Planctomycetes bacterium]|nr:endonuclease/exonuclease/phosphatase family protein [Planctomycetota bacterium]